MAGKDEKSRSLSEIRSVLKRVERHLAKSKVGDDVARDVEAYVVKLKAAIESDKSGGFRKDLSASRQAAKELEDIAVAKLGYKPKSPTREYVESIGVAVLVALLLRAFVVEPFKIPTGSMIPTLLIGDHIFVSKFTYGLRVPFTEIFMVEFAKPARGEVVVFTFPVKEARAHVKNTPREQACIDEGSLREPKDFIKRIIGLPGDVIEIREGQLYLNQNPLPRTLESRTPTGSFMAPVLTQERETSGEYTYTIQYRRPHEDFGPVKVNEGHFFVMGDHRDDSSDSRCWGQVPMENIKGRALFIWLSLSDQEGEFIRWSRFGSTIH